MNPLDGKQKLVSIVLPVYNGARFLYQAIESCLNQTYRNLELIVVDDGSTDDSINIVKSYDDDRIKLVCHGVNKKLPAALNTGFNHTSGEYLTWTSHDNYFAPTAIAEMVTFLEENCQVDLVFANDYHVDEVGHILREFRPGPFEQLASKMCIGGCFLYRRRVYEVLGPYSEQAFLAEDYEYWLRASACFTLAHLDRPLHYYRQHSDSLSTRFGGGAIRETTVAVRRRFLSQNLWGNRLLLHQVHLAGAINLYDRNNHPAAARLLFWAIVFNPFCIANTRVLGLLVALCVGDRGVVFLQKVKHRIRRIAFHSP